MRIRRDLHLGLWLAFMVLCLAESSSAALGQVFFNPASHIAAPYETFEVDIVVDAAMRDVHCFRTQVSFLRPNVRILSISEGPLLSTAGSTFFIWKDTMGVYDIFNCVLGNGLYANGPGVLATIKFATDSSPCTTPLQFTYVLFEDPLLDSMAVQWSDGIIVVPSCCDCSHQGDVNSDLVIDVFDVIEVIGIAFSGLPDIHDPQCPTTRGDVNNDGGTDVFDVVYIIGTAFSGGASPIDPCSTGGR